MKKIIGFFLVIVLLFSTASSATSSAAVSADIAHAILQWQILLNQHCESIANSDSSTLGEQVSTTMDLISLLIVDEASKEQASASTSIGQNNTSYLNVKSNSIYTDIYYLPELNVNCEAEVQYDESYLVAKLSMYQTDGSLIGIQRVELGVREDEFMALLVDYDNITGLTGRFAMYPQKNDPRIIFTKTIGKTLDICLDVRAWADGVDYSEWSKTLLLPNAVLYQID